MKSISYIIFINLVYNFHTNVGQRRVSHGTRPPAFSYPYTSQVLIEAHISGVPAYSICTGSIISDLIVLTAGKVSKVIR